MKKRLKTNGIIMTAAILSLVAFPSVFFRNSVKISGLDDTLKILGIFLILLGQIFRASGRGYKSEYSQCGKKLMQSGPYSLVRNPMYLGIVLIGLGIILILFKWWVACAFLLIFIFRYILLTYQEEEKLLAIFGDEYRIYCRKVPRIFPSITILANRELAEYLLLKPAWLKKELGSMLALLLCVFLLAFWKDFNFGGISLYFREVVIMLFVILLFILLEIYLFRRTSLIEKRCSK